MYTMEVLMASAEEVGLQLTRIDYRLQQGSATEIGHIMQANAWKAATRNLHWSLIVCEERHYTVVVSYVSGIYAVLDSKEATVVKVKETNLSSHTLGKDAVYLLHQKQVC